MKNIFIAVLFLFICLFGISGCKSNNIDQDFILQLQDYLDTNGQKCLQYVDNDKSLNGRDKEIYKGRHRTIQKQLDKYKTGEK